MNTCDTCKRYTPSDWPKGLYYEKYCYDGVCSRSIDTNSEQMREDSLGGWDEESYSAGVYVGPKFGCIFWESK